MALSEGAVDDFIARSFQGAAVQLRMPGYQVDHLPGGPALIVTFEPATMGKAEPDLNRPVWGQAFLQKRGHSVLGVKRVATAWYRSADLHQLFRALQTQGFFDRFEQVMFYGPSMGGYAALSLAAAAPGCTVLALNPQSTLAPDRVWFDQRFAGGRGPSWQGDFVDGVDGAATARRVYVCYDPYQVKDHLHAKRLPVHNRVNLRLPFVGHTTAQALNGLGLLGAVFDQALAGTLDEAAFRQLARARVRSADYHVRLAERGLWLPRRLRHLSMALALDPAHARAALLQRLWRDEPPVTASTPDAHDRPGTLRAPPAAKVWPKGLVTAPRVPLVYLRVPKSASTTVQNHLLYMAEGAYPDRPQDIQQHPGLRRSRDDQQQTHALISRQLDEGAVVFTFVRDPGHRAYACFHEKTGAHSGAMIRRTLQRHWGLRLAGPDEPTTLEQQRENFAAYLRFVEANLAGDTDIRRDPHWCPQGKMLVQYRKHLKIDVVGKVENFAADMALILHRAGVRRVPDVTARPWRNPPAPFTFKEVLTPTLQILLNRLYEADYVHLGYRSDT